MHKNRRKRCDRLGWVLLAGSILYLSGCGIAADSNNTGSDSAKRDSVKTAPVEPAVPSSNDEKERVEREQTLDGKVVKINLKDGVFKPNSVQVKAGVLTLRLKNSESGSVARLELRDGRTIIAEGGPASDSQLSEVTVPVELNKTYKFRLAGRENSPQGTVSVRD